MARSSKLRIMISSRCNDCFPQNALGRPLSEIRKELKEDLEGLSVFGKTVFEVWINETTPPQGGSWDSWDVCLEAVRDCDILLVLSNGNAGWADDAGGIGVCHAEFMTGLAQAPGKVRVIDLGNIEIGDDDEGTRNKRFQDDLTRRNLFHGGKALTIDELKSRVKDAAYDALIKLAQAGVRESSRGPFSSGEALDWSHLNFAARQRQMQRVLRDTIRQRTGSSEDGEHLIVSIDGTEVLLIAHAIPAAMSVGPAKEMVGQPFLRDHKLSDFLQNGRGGPVHIIACHKNATETQASKMLGFPDATVVTGPFGVFVADNIQKVQFVFIVNCRDATTTRHGVQRFFAWLTQTGEDALLAQRAGARARIVHAIAKETSA